MKWVLVSNQRSTLQEYHLVDNEDCKAVMKYNPLHCSARISCESQHRIFFIESTGSLTGKYIFKNEYGMEVGNMNHDGWLGKDGRIMIESTKYAYSIQNNPQVELAVYNGISKQLLVNCSFTTNHITDGISLSSSTSNIIKNTLLLGLCWYLFLPVAKQHAV